MTDKWAAEEDRRYAEAAADPVMRAVLDVLAPSYPELGGSRSPVFEFGHESTPTAAEVVELSQALIDAVDAVRGRGGGGRVAGMTMRVTRDRSDDDHDPAAAVVIADDEGGDQMIVSPQAFAEFVGRVKAGEFDEEFDPTTGQFRTR